MIKGSIIDKQRDQRQDKQSAEKYRNGVNKNFNDDVKFGKILKDKFITAFPEEQTFSFCSAWTTIFMLTARPLIILHKQDVHFGSSVMDFSLRGETLILPIVLKGGLNVLRLLFLLHSNTPNEYAHREFLNDIPYFNGELRTYAQLLYQKDIIANALIKHLNVLENTSLKTLLELTIAFVLDVREDFKNYIWGFIEAIINILERSHENKEILETSFFTLAKIFWLQRRYLVHELCEVFRHFKRIFCCKRPYLRRFTAEALAFLLRKSSAIGKLTIFLAEIAYNVKEIDNSLLIDGISRLYFNALKITKGQFHSMAPQLLSEILRASFEIKENDVQNVAIQILVSTMCHCSIYTSKEYSALLVDVILEEYKSATVSFNIMKSSALAKLLNAWVSQKMGKSLHKPSSLFQVIIDGAKAELEKYHGDSELHTLITTAVRMLTNDNQKFYANICSIRRPIWKSKGERNCFFDISHHLEVRNKLIDILKAADKFDTEILEIAAVFNILVRSMSCLDSIDARLSLLSANACFLFDPSLFSQFTLDTLLKYYKNMGNNEAALRTLVLMLPFVEDREKLKNISAMSKVANEILPMFGHWSSYVRQVALEILVHFKIPVNNKRSNDGTTIEVESAFNLLLHSERIPWTLEEYRTRLMILRQLTYGAHTKHMPKGFDTIIETIPLRVIIGNLYEPFTIAWNELKNIIQDYAYGLNIDTFFSLFLSFIDQVELKNQRVLCENSDISNDCDILDKMTIIADKNPQNYDLDENFARITKVLLLIKSGNSLEIIRNEYQHGNLLERRENILSISTLICTINKDEEKDGPNDDSPEIIGKSDDDEVIVEDKYVERKLIRNSLIALLELFANFTSPKIIFMANEIRDLYDELLMVADEGVQQRALNCIFTYNYKYLTPYREYLESLVQDRTLINGLMKFSIDDHNSVVDSSHRASVMPIVLRLLYGKCNVHCKKDMTERRAAIFRFLAGSTSNELDFFLRMLFAPLLKIIGEDKQSLEIFCKQTVSTFDASSMVPLQIIKGFALFS
ncbi:hypothetical protein DINM_003265 [Dirofilaria immitis]|nr:hypothetical protein [Dirofilaria immitis]